MKNLLNEVGHPIAYHPELSRALKSVNAAILLCQLVYWMGKGHDAAGWVYKSATELEFETGLSQYKQVEARKVLKKHGIIEEKLQRIPPKVHFRIKEKNLNQFWENYKNKALDPSTTNEEKSDNNSSSTEKSYTESTKDQTKITSEMERDSELNLKMGRIQENGFNPISKVLNDRPYLNRHKLT